MEAEPRLSLQVVELIHYCTDVDASTAFYRDQLGWGVIWQTPGSLTMLDAGGAYQLTLAAARWSPNWQAGQSVPPPRLCLQSRDIRADVTGLAGRGLTELTVQGDAASMLSANIPFVEGIELFAWQDTADNAASGVAAAYRARAGREQRYSLGECIFFVEDKPSALDYLVDRLGFSVKFSHGSVYTALAIDDGPIVGLFDLPALQRDPVFSPTMVRTRLFLECPDLDAEYERQMKLGAAPGEILRDPDGLKWFSTADPDGTLVTFWQYTPPAA